MGLTGIYVPSVAELAWAGHSIPSFNLPLHAATFLMMLHHSCRMWQLWLHLGDQAITAVSIAAL